MYEVWTNEEDPVSHIVKAEGTPFPARLAMLDWSLIGKCRVADDIAAEVKHQGFVPVRLLVPFDPNKVLGEKP